MATSRRENRHCLSDGNTAEENDLKGSSDLALLGLLGFLLLMGALRRQISRS